LDRAEAAHSRGLLGSVPAALLYEAAVTVMMRLVFLHCAEEQELVHSDDLSTLRQELRAAAEEFGEEILEARHDAWCRLLAWFRAAHGGRLFDPDRFPFLEGRKAGTSWRETESKPLPVNNRTVLLLLEALQGLVLVPGGAGRPGFQAANVEQIGHVYEGLLDHTARRVAEPHLGLAGVRHREPVIALAKLEELRARGEAELLEFLQDETGRSPTALRKGLQSALDPQQTSRFRAACQGDEGLWQRVQPFAGLVRSDALGFPVIIPRGGVFVTAGTNRRSSGTHYTPRCLTEPIVQDTLEPLVYVGPAEGKPKEDRKLRSARELLELKICDLACGCGAFLVQACRYLSQRLLQAWAECSPESLREQAIPLDPAERQTYARRLVAQCCLYGVDSNPLAVEMARLSLRLLTLARDQPPVFLDHAIRCGDALFGMDDLEALKSLHLDPPQGRQTFHWPLEFPEVYDGKGGFDAVLGNPPWGQKAIDASPSYKEYLQRYFTSARGIFDLFRPFAERAVRLLRPGGCLGLVLPDIVLLKDYPQTRKFLVDSLTFLRLGWHGRAFAGAAMDAATLVACKAPAPAGHHFHAVIAEQGTFTERLLPQSRLSRPPAYVFNLHADDDRHNRLERLAECPRLGSYFEIHEGAHSGNIRRELFLERPLDASCRELFFGRDELRPYALRWAGRYIRLSVLPARNTRQRYANPGQPHWFAQPKLLVRRTGDHVLAAVDESGRYASNNFFVVFPQARCALDLHGLAALLNSHFMTWYFRAVVPRQGRAFAELKIRTLAQFPLPPAVPHAGSCDELNRLGRQRSEGCGRRPDGSEQERMQTLDRCIDAAVGRLFQIDISSWGGQCGKLENGSVRPPLNEKRVDFGKR
jgi:type I restriction-modification system DNA methylase subunit